MKVIITGATGYVGTQVLNYAIADPRISHIVLLQRRETLEPFTRTAKQISTVIHKDFLSYPEDVLRKLIGAEAILWALGGRHDKFPDLATAQKVNVDFIRAAITAFEQSLIPTLPPGKKLRFVLCSGKGAEWNQEAKLWFMAETRLLKGAAEQAVFTMAKARPEKVEAYACRPAVVLSTSPGLIEWLHGAIAPSVTVKELGATMVDLSVHGSEESFWEFGMIRKTGKQIVRERGI